MFQLTQEPLSGSCNQRLAKITSLVQHQDHFITVRICRHNTDNFCINMRSWTRLVILAKHWL